MALIWLIKVVFYNVFFSLQIKVGESTDLTYYQKNKDLILNKAKDYYKNKDRLREQARNKYIKLSEEEKNKKREYGENRYHSMSEEKK